MKTAKKTLVYAVLIIGALIMVLPFFWMLISSLKTAAEVNTTPPTFWPEKPCLKIMSSLFQSPVSNLFSQLSGGDGLLRSVYHVYHDPCGFCIFAPEVSRP